MLSMARIRMRRLSSKPLILVLALALISSIRRCHASESIIGSRETCDVEGEDFTVDKIPNTRCFNCLCKNGFVECRKQQCPSIEGCYTLLEPREDECCHRCKGWAESKVVTTTENQTRIHERGDRAEKAIALQFGREWKHSGAGSIVPSAAQSRLLFLALLRLRRYADKRSSAPPRVSLSLSLS
ncbi:uncharacterized protein LOC116414278, partial [Apis florea]|uniref:uncharacterized protein LOC116414278 n=1 Tax=Apis florea TaxID=7463 RepID=UPI0012FEF775